MNSNMDALTVLPEVAADVAEGVGEFQVLGSKFKVQGSRFKVQGSKFKVQSSKYA